MKTNSYGPVYILLRVYEGMKQVSIELAHKQMKNQKGLMKVRYQNHNSSDITNIIAIHDLFSDELHGVIQI